MSKKTTLIIALIFGVLFVSCNSKKETTSNGEKNEVKNVIFLIGDGMGLPHIYAAKTVSTSPLNIERFTTVGLQSNFSANNYVTDSGASGTALATGSKTNNGSIGVDAEGKTVKSILEIA